MHNNPMKFLRLLAQAPRNCWVALNDEEDGVAGWGSTITQALEQARNAGVQDPLVLWSPGVAEADARSANATAVTTVLVVDDEEGVCQLAGALLESEGFTALPADSPQTAVRLAQEHPIDVLLTDVLMPGMDGRQLAERIGALRPAAKMLFMSGHTADPLVQNLMGKYEMCFLRKPFSKEALVSKLRWVLEKPEACSVSHA